MASDVIKWELFATLYRLDIIKTKLHLHELGANWEVGHTQYVTSQLLHVRFQPDKVRLVGLGFIKINPFVL